MQEQYKQILIKGCLLGVLIASAFLTEKVVIFGVPLYLHELFIGSALVIFLSRPSFSIEIKEFFRSLPREVWIAGVMVVLGIGTSIIANEISPHGYGRIKSWVIFPAIYLVLVAISLIQNILSRKEYLWAVTIGGIGIVLQALAWIDQGGITYDGRLRGAEFSPNFLAMMLILPLLSSIFIAQSGKGIARIFGIGGALLMGGALLLTRSHSVWIGVFAGVGMLLWHSLREKRMEKILVLTFLLGGLVFLEDQDGKWSQIFSQNERSSVASREMIWKSSLKMIETNPWTGIGPGNFQETYLEYQKYFPPYLEWSVPHPHNMYLAAWLEWGFLGCVGLVAFFAGMIRMNSGLAKEKALSGVWDPIRGFFVAVLVVGLVDVPLFQNDLALMMALAGGMTLGWYIQEKKNGQREMP